MQLKLHFYQIHQLQNIDIKQIYQMLNETYFINFSPAIKYLSTLIKMLSNLIKSKQRL